MALAAAKFYLCEESGNVLELIVNGDVNPLCDMKGLKELKANTNDVSDEVHLPKVKVDGDKVMVTIGKGEELITPEHSILWIALETTKGMKRTYIHQEYMSKSDIPRATFILFDEDPVAVYAYCNVHGLLKTKIIPE